MDRVVRERSSLVESATAFDVGGGEPLEPRPGGQRAEAVGERLERQARVADDLDIGSPAERERVRVDVDADHAGAGVERPSGEHQIELRPGHEHHVRLAVGDLRRTRKEIREAEAQLVIVRNQAARRTDREEWRSGRVDERAERVRGSRPEASAPGDHDRPLGRGEQRARGGDALGIGCRRLGRQRLGGFRVRGEELDVDGNLEHRDARPSRSGVTERGREELAGVVGALHRLGPLGDRAHDGDLIEVSRVSRSRVALRPTPPVIQTSGIPDSCASASAVTALVRPGPPVTSTTPVRPVDRA